MPVGIGYDERRGVLVAARDASGTDADYQAFLDAINQLDRDAHAAARVPVCILLTQPDTPAPNALWRKRYGEAAAKNQCPKMFFALVSESALQRGALRVVRWIQGDGAGVAEPFDTFENAAAAAEKYRGEPLPELRVLRRTAQAQLR